MGFTINKMKLVIIIKFRMITYNFLDDNIGKVILYKYFGIKFSL